LEKKSWIAGIISTIFAIGWGIFTYLKPPEGQPQAPANQNTQTGNNNINVQGNGNSIGVSLASRGVIANDPELELEKLSIGVTRASVESTFGVPRFDRFEETLKLRNLIFVFPRFFLQTVIDGTGNVVFFSVTTRSSAFRPKVPKSEGRLLDSKFEYFGKVDHIYSDMTSKYYEYAEKFYLGNAGNYKNYYLGFCPAGEFSIHGETGPYVSSRDPSHYWAKFRKENAPNCFGVGEIPEGEEDAIRTIRIGLDYYLARDVR
jgi:hypothetical protein